MGADRTLTAVDETRFDRGAWLTLLAAILLMLLPVVRTLFSIQYPSDGWIQRSVSAGQNQYVNKVTSQPSNLLPGDILLAINGQPFKPEQLPPLPSNLQVGQVLTYTIQRGAQTLDVQVTLVRRTISEVLRGTIQQILDSPADTLVPTLSFFIALPLFLLRPGNAAARYLLIIFSYYGPFSAVGFVDYHFFRTTYPGWLRLLIELEGGGWSLWFFPSWTLLSLSMPVRKWPLTRYPRLVPALLYGWPLVLAAANYAAGLITGGLSNDLLNILGFLPVTLAFLVALFGSLIHNFFTLRDPVARAQLRWIALGLGLGWGVPIATLSFLVVTGRLNPVSDVDLFWLTLLLPVCLAIAITRYRLFDFDVIIRKTLVYSFVTGLLTLVYFGGVALLQGILTADRGPQTAGNAAVGSPPSAVVIVVTTLTIAALFNPLRRRVQDFIDRRFYRQKYNAEKALAEFAAVARSEADLAQLSERLTFTVQETLQPERVSLWLKPALIHKNAELEVKIK